MTAGEMKNGHGSKYPSKWRLVIAALLSEPTIDQAAAKAKVSPTTIWRWLQNRDFQDHYERAKREAYETAMTRLQNISGEAVSTLRKSLSCGQPAVEYRAAVSILELALKASEHFDLLRRVEILERRRGFRVT